MVEAYKLTGGGEYLFSIERPEILARFLDHCMLNGLTIECVPDSYFSELDYSIEKPFTDFNELQENAKL
mgnify:CR=1 FL=1